MNNSEVLQIALDALVYADNELTAPMDDTTLIRNAIAVVRQALAQKEKNT